MDFSDWPTVEEGMLVFRDTSHVSSYIDFLNNSIQFQMEATEDVSQDPNEILQGIENVINFESLRNVSQAAFDVKNEIGWSSISEVPDVHFINDIAIRSILNSNADVQIGDKITHFINKDYAAIIDYSHKGLLNGLHNLGENATLVDIQTLDVGDNFTLDLLSQTNIVTVAQRGTGFGMKLNDVNVTTPNVCSEPLKVKLDNLGVTAINYSGSGGTFYVDFTIMWGDGLSDDFRTTGINANNTVTFAKKNDIYHTYATQGQKTITVKAKAYNLSAGLYYTDDRDFTITVPNQCNAEVQHTEKVEIFDVYGMARSIRCKEWVEQWQRAIGRRKVHSIGASTESIHLESNKWRKSRIDGVGASYTGTVSSTDCVTTWGDGRTTRNGNSNSAEATYTNPDHIGWTQITCSHYARIGTRYITHDHVLTPCQ